MAKQYDLSKDKARGIEGKKRPKVKPPKPKK
jgi:hypothetical protein